LSQLSDLYSTMLRRTLQHLYMSGQTLKCSTNAE